MGTTRRSWGWLNDDDERLFSKYLLCDRHVDVFIGMDRDKEQAELRRIVDPVDSVESSLPFSWPSSSGGSATTNGYATRKRFCGR
jgi:hypothetical protein